MVLAYPNFDLPFIMTTDASRVAVATILSQVQNGLQSPVAYASRQLNKSEQAYSVSEAELLALVWAAKCRDTIETCGLGQIKKPICIR
jgi:hypothetical protein